VTPQPLSKVMPGSTLNDLIITPAFLEIADPVLVGLVMRVIATWSYVDLALTDLISVFLRADFEVVNEMFIALIGSTQRRAVRDAASLTLSENDRELYVQVMKRLGPIEKHRNDFAHSIWAYARSMPEALLLIDPKALARHNAKYIVTLRGMREWIRWVNTHPGSDADWTTAPEAPELAGFVDGLDQSLVMVYRKKDLEQELAAVQRAERLVQTLHDMIALADDEARSALAILLQQGQSSQPEST